MRFLQARLVKELKLSKVFATGFCNGADLCYLLACQQDLFLSAIAPVAGTMMEKWNKNSQSKVSIIAVHGTDDKVKFWNGGYDGIEKINGYRS